MSLSLDRSPSSGLTSDSCESCKQIIKDAEDYLANPNTQQALVAIIDVNVCPVLPQQYIDICKAEAPILVAQAINITRQAISAQDVCAILGVCSPSSEFSIEAQSTLPENSGMECPLCRIVMSTVILRLKDPDTRKAIEDNAKEACENFADEDKVQKCLADVDDLFDSIDALLDDLEANHVCHILQFCDAGREKKHTLQAAALKDDIVALMTMPKSDSSSCDTCKTIVMEVAAVMANPTTQQEILTYAKEACTSLGKDYQDQCIQYVEMYGPLIFTLALGYLQPEPLCVRLHYCKAPTAVLMS